MIPIVVRPKLLAIKNRWVNSLDLHTQFGRDIVIGFFSIAVMLSIYFGMSVTLSKLNQTIEMAYLHPSVVWGILLLFLLGLLLFSNCVSALGALFLGQDLDLILSAPVSRPKFFWGKLVEVVGSSTWMVLVFGLPAMIAFQSAYEADLGFYAQAFVVLLPYFLGSSAFAITVVTLFTSLVPANRTREILVVAAGFVIVAGYMAFRLMTDRMEGEVTTMNDLLHLLSLLQIHKATMSPSYWAAVCLGESLVPTGKSLLPYIGLLYGVSISLCALAYLTVRLLHFKAYSMSRVGRQSGRLKDTRSYERIIRLTPYLNPQFRALLTKEFRVFLRDMTQTVQLMLLLGLCTVYLYNLRILRIVEELPEATRVWWQAFLVIGNMAMGAFVIAAVCTRFVFPSVSLEGKSYWVLRSSPMPLERVLRAKFWMWLIPVATIGSVLLTSGAFAINADMHIVVVSGLISWIVCYGIVGLGIGLGSLYANFDWEHTSQLAASFGSLIYMIASTVLIAINLIPTTIIILMRSMKTLSHHVSMFEWYVSITSCALLLMYLNYTTTKWALKVGQNALLAREK